MHQPLIYILTLVIVFTACRKEKPAVSDSSSYYHKVGDSIVSIIYVPNSFTPNGDGLNDVFYPVPLGCDQSTFEMQIMTRNNKIIFKTHSIDIGWDGTHGPSKAPSGVYYYEIHLKDTTGYHYNIVNTVSLIQ